MSEEVGPSVEGLHFLLLGESMSKTLFPHFWGGLTDLGCTYFEPRCRGCPWWSSTAQCVACNDTTCCSRANVSSAGERLMRCSCTSVTAHMDPRTSTTRPGLGTAGIAEAVGVAFTEHSLPCVVGPYSILTCADVRYGGSRTPTRHINATTESSGVVG